MTVTDADVVESAYAVLGGITDGSLSGAAVEQRAVEVCRRTFGAVGGPDDPLWPVQIDVARQVLGHCGIPAAELAQWLSAARSRENPGSATDCQSASVSALSEAHSLDSGGADGDPEGDPNHVARRVDSVDAMDNDEFADIPEAVMAEADAAAMSVIDRYRQQREGTR